MHKLLTFISDATLACYVIYDILIIRSDRRYLSDIHRVGACSSNVDRHDFQCTAFISEATLAYFVINPCCRRYCFLITGCSTNEVIGLFTPKQQRSYMEHSRHTRTPYSLSRITMYTAVRQKFVSLVASYHVPTHTR